MKFFGILFGVEMPFKLKNGKHFACKIWNNTMVWVAYTLIHEPSWSDLKKYPNTTTLLMSSKSSK